MARFKSLLNGLKIKSSASLNKLYVLHFLARNSKEILDCEEWISLLLDTILKQLVFVDAALFMCHIHFRSGNQSQSSDSSVGMALGYELDNWGSRI
jgi:hypothetical protein